MSELTFSHFTSIRQQARRATAPMAALRVGLRTYLTRQALPDLTARELSDIGLTRPAALAEAARLPWDTDPRPRPRVPHTVLGHIQRAWHRARTRRLLAEMNARELRDIGVTLTDAHMESSKPFWQS